MKQTRGVRSQGDRPGGSGWGLGLLVGMLGALGCSSVAVRHEDLPRPAEVRGTVDFTGIFGRHLVGNSVYVSSRDQALLQRVMLSPNLTFEASRSSLHEPDTVGPANPSSNSPALPNALGSSVSIFASSLLLRFLIEHDASLVAPMVSRIWCSGATTCPEATWVERVMMMAHAAPLATTGDATGASDDRFPLPTALLAVRELGLAWHELGVVVETEGNHYRVRVSSDGLSLCRELHVSVPVLSFSAEVISTSTGQVVARIDEVRSIETTVAMQRPIVVSSFEPVQMQENINGFVYSYVGNWRTVSVACASVDEAFHAFRRDLATNVDEGGAIQELIRSSLDPLFRARVVAPPSRRVSQERETHETPVAVVVSAPPQGQPAAPSVPTRRHHR